MPDCETKNKHRQMTYQKCQTRLIGRQRRHSVTLAGTRCPRLYRTRPYNIYCNSRTQAGD